jgi:cobalamin transport system substrate-binding protein
MRPFARARLACVAICVSYLALGTGAALQRPARVISVIPAVTEMLFAMGAGDQVVGVSSYDRYPPEVASRERVGALLDPNIERILALKPDLVIVYGTQQEFIARLGRAGIPTFEYQHAGLADITVTMRRLGQRVGRAQESERLAAQVEREIAEIRKQVAGRPRPKTAIVFDRESGSLRSMYASAGIGFMHDMLEAAGGADVFADQKRQSLQLSAETLLARAPEVIIEVKTSEGWSPERIASELSVWKALSALPAVRTGRVHILTDDRLSIPGPRVAEAIRLLARVLHPSAVRSGGTKRERAAASEPRERSGAQGVPASERARGSGGTKSPGKKKTSRVISAEERGRK